MMDVPLNAWTLFRNAGVHHRHVEIVTRGSGRATHRYTYGDFASRTQQLMHGLDSLGLERGARIATLAWNGYRHLEAYFAIPCTGRVLHTVNIRLSADDLAYVLGHARDVALLVDPEFVPAVASITSALPDLRHVIVMGGELPGDVSSVSPVRWHRYDELLDGHAEIYPAIDIPESTLLGLCYTSGTTGRPKGVEYTHRSTFLHALAVSSGAAMSIGPSDAVLPQVPMFHASAWGMPFAAVAVGAKQVFFAGALDAGAFVDAMLEEQVTIAAGVPTVWLAVADELAARGATLPALRHIVCGGSQPPRSLIDRYRTEFGIPIVQAWGMTETSPLASMAWPQHRMRDWDDDAISNVARSQAGLPLPGSR
jgi:fatty-acyl-CoA synthase